MTWERFGYICRKASATISADNKVNSYISNNVDSNINNDHYQTIAERLHDIESEVACDLYGKRMDYNSWSQKILQAIASMPDANRAQETLAIYQDLNLTKSFAEPMQFKRIIAYLSLTVLMFYIMVTIYTIKITPVFVDFFESTGQTAPVQLMSYQYYSGSFILLVSILLIFALVMGFQLKALFRFQAGVENSLIIKYLTFPSIRKSYLKVIDILTFPLLATNQQDEFLYRQHSSSVIVHLQSVKNANMSVAKEMQELIEIEMHELLVSCENQLKLISTLIAVIVASAILFFLVSVYAPIFMFGNAV